MKLSLQDIKSITRGAVEMFEEDGKIVFSRFTKEQLDLYEEYSKKMDRHFDDRSRATAGVKLNFLTDSEKLLLTVDTSYATSRNYFSFDVFVNGKMKDSVNNFEGFTFPKKYTEVELPLGTFSKEIELGKKEKEVTIYFPWSACGKICELSLDDGAKVEPIKKEKTLLAFGDSITQGYDALYPSNRYASRLAEMLGADEINKGIGGEVFFPDLAMTKEDLSPDYVTVAYGTNDWNRVTKDEFLKNCREFYLAIAEKYKNSKIFAITPIWRKNYLEERPFGDFLNIDRYIKECVSDIPNVHAISGFDLVPKDENLFSDLYLHPTDEGFAFYAENLYKEISKLL